MCEQHARDPYNSPLLSACDPALALRSPVLAVRRSGSEAAISLSKDATSSNSPSPAPPGLADHPHHTIDRCDEQSWED